MSSGPDNINDMIWRALAAQAELGLGEIIIGTSDKVHPKETAEILATCDQVVSVAPAVSTEIDPSVLEPDSPAMIIAEPEYSSLTEHRQAICECKRCGLGETRTKFVYGAGSPKADLMFIGEAPGADEDRQGEPFVGRAGQMLDKILAAMKLRRDEIYIANILKCRPPGNRDPLPEEMDKCFEYLREQVRLIRPKIICAMGRIAAQALLNTGTPLGKLRRNWHTYEGVPMMVTYHPAALLRFQKYKRDTWEDMKMLLAKYESMK